MTDFYYTYPLPRFLFLHLCGILIGFRTDGNHQPVPISESRQDSAFCLTGCILFFFLLFHFNFYRSRFQTSSTYFYLHLPCNSFLPSNNSQCQTVERLPFSTLERSEWCRITIIRSNQFIQMFITDWLKKQSKISIQNIMMLLSYLFPLLHLAI